MRRPQGTGSIRKRSNGTFEARYPTGRDGNKTTYATKYARTWEEAERALSELALRVRDERDTLVATEATLGSWLTVWAAEHTRDLSEGTKLKTTWHVERVNAQPQAQISLRALKVRDFETLFRALVDDGLRPTTVQGIASTVRRALKKAVSEELIASNPAMQASLPKAPGDEPIRAKLIPPQHLRAILTHPHRWQDLWVLIASLGLRHGEALGLKWGDINLTTGEVSIQRAVVVRGNKAVVSTTKTKASKRVLYANSDAQAALLRLRAGSEGTGFVFTSSSGSLLIQNNVRRDWHQMLEELNLPNYRIHDLRHTYATLLCGVTDPKTASVVLGHTDVRFTLDRYVQADTDRMRRAAAAVKVLD